MAILKDSNQYKYTGRGPIDAKALVKTYADLLSTDTWLVDGKVAAYNGMVTAVWLDKENADKNGIYFLYDPLVVSAIKVPDVTKESNWNKITSQIDVAILTNAISAETARAVEEEKKLANAVSSNKNAIDILVGTGNGSVQQMVANAIARVPVATSSIAGLVRASEEITVTEEGILKIGQVLIEKLELGSRTLVLNGGNSIN